MKLYCIFSATQEHIAGGLPFTSVPPRCCLLMPEGDISPRKQTKVYCSYRRVPLSGPFSARDQICQCLTVQPRNYKGSIVAAIQMKGSSSEMSTVQPAYQLAKTLKHMGSFGFCVSRTTSLSN